MKGLHARRHALAIPVAAALVLAAGPASGAGAAINFGSVEQFRFKDPVGSSEFGATLVAEDFDRDGSVDLVAAAGERSTFLRGSLRGKFTPISGEPIQGPATGYQDVETANLNGDTNTDLVVAGGGSYAGDVRVMLGNGDGSFQAGTRIEIERQDRAHALAVDDLDGDGDQDVTVALHLGGVQVMNGDGAGGLTPTATYPVPGNCCAALKIAQLDDNASPDIAVLDPFGVLNVLLSDGAGGYALQPPIPLADPLGLFSSLDLADLNGDGNMDVAVSNESDRDPALHVLLGNGLGGFSERPPTPLGFQIASVSGPDLVMLAEVDRAPGIDAVVGSPDPRYGAFLVLPGDGAGGFGPQVSFAAHMGPSGVAAGDFNADGRPDLAGAHYFEALSITTMFGRGGSVRCDSEPADFIGQEPGQTQAFKGRTHESESVGGTPGDDVISLGADADGAFPGKGDDTVCGGAAGDRIATAKGDDVLLGGPGPDSLNGGAGKDACVGGAGNDKLRSCERGG